MTTKVIIQFDIEGFHFYPDAPKKVSFLKDRHRHTFVIKCAYKVNHNNREKEIFICRDAVKNYLITKYGFPCEFGAMSCEHIATDILKKYKKEMSMVSVWEENTGGAIVSI